MKKKRFVTMFLTVASAIMLAACSSSSDTASDTTAAADSADTSDDASEDTSDTASDSSVDDIIARGVLKVGVKADVPKFSLQNTATGEYEGFEDDLAYEIAGEIFGVSADEAKEQGLVEFEAVNAKTRGPLIENGELDCVIATFTITDERKETYNFSPAYYTDAVGILVNVDSGIESVKDLDGKIIGVAQSSTSQAEFENYVAENDIDVDVEFQEFATYPELAQALAADQIDAFSVDRAILEGYRNDSNMFLDVRYGYQDYGVCSAKEKTALADLIADKIQTMLDNGEIEALLLAHDISVD